MYQPIQFKTTTSPIGNSINRSPVRRACLFLPLVLAWLALSPLARAQCKDGCGTNGNTFQGVFALGANTTGSGNTAFGDTALNFNTTGSENTAVGFDALETNKTGSFNTATGFGALFKNTGTANTAFGSNALEFNTTGNFNTATGQGALMSNTTASDNTATGDNALLSNTTGSLNTATGTGSLKANTVGFDNTANGYRALFTNTSGIYNTANGLQALFNNTTGIENTATGVNALFSNTTGGSNVALGYQAGLNLTTGSNNIDIGTGVLGVAGEANTIRIGATQTKTFIAGIHGATASGGAAVFINASGELGTLTSSARFKEAIKPMDKASEVILALRPVTFRYKHELDPQGIPQFGLVAEQVEKVNPDLVARDDQGKPYTVRYEAVNAMLLNEFLKEHRKVEDQEHKEQEQEARLTKQDAIIARQQKQIETLTATVQKVSDQLESNRRAPQLVANDQ